MDKEKMVLYLGYCALILIAIYFTYGILKISGEGLASLGYENNFIREGFSDKQKESTEKNLKDQYNRSKSLLQIMEDGKEKINAINDMPEYEELIELYKSWFDYNIRWEIQNTIVSGKDFDKKMERVQKLEKTKELLDNYTL